MTSTFLNWKIELVKNTRATRNSEHGINQHLDQYHV